MPTTTIADRVITSDDPDTIEFLSNSPMCGKIRKESVNDNFDLAKADLHKRLREAISKWESETKATVLINYDTIGFFADVDQSDFSMYNNKQP